MSYKQFQEPLKEETIIFKHTPEQCKKIEFVEQIEYYSVYSQELYIKDSNLPKKLLDDYFKAQHLLDPIFESKEGVFAYKKARELLFPLSVRGSQKNANRAGDKLAELLEIAGIKYEKDYQLKCADVCAAPGAWSIYLLQQYPNGKCVGMSMPVEGTEKSKTWYLELTLNKRFKATFGEDETGQDEQTNKQLDLLVCDGGFAIYKDPEGKHCEQLQEIITARLLHSEFTTCLLLVKEGGSFACKMYDSISNELIVVKPAHSRVSNAEKYLVFKGMKKCDCESKDEGEKLRGEVFQKLTKLYNEYQENMVPTQIFKQVDNCKQFDEFLDKVNKRLITRCTISLNQIVEETHYIMDSNKPTSITIIKRDQEDYRDRRPYERDFRQDQRSDRVYDDDYRSREYYRNDERDYNNDYRNNRRHDYTQCENDRRPYNPQNERQRYNPYNNYYEGRDTYRK